MVIVLRVVPLVLGFLCPQCVWGTQTMADAKDKIEVGKDREDWDRHWRAMPHRRLSLPPKAGVGVDVLGGFGEPISYTISQDPPEFCDRIGRESERCPICGEQTAREERLPACLHPRWASGLSIGFGVWVHRACFMNCPDTDEPAPIPW